MPKLTNPTLALKNFEGFGKRVAALRAATGMDRREFAKKCNISYKHFFNIENGQAIPGLRGYVAICLAGGVKDIPLIGRRD